MLFGCVAYDLVLESVSTARRQHQSSADNTMPNVEQANSHDRKDGDNVEGAEKNVVALV